MEMEVGERGVGGGGRGENRKELQRETEKEKLPFRGWKRKKKVKTHGRRETVRCPSERETPAPVAS